MSRPPIANPKNKHIRTRTTLDLYTRFMRVCERKGLTGDDWIVLFLGTFENDNDNVKSQIAIEKMKLKSIRKQMRELENEKVSCENIIEELNSDATGSRDVEAAVNVILQRFRMQSVYNIYQFLEENQTLLENQALLAGISEDELYMKVFNKA